MKKLTNKVTPIILLIIGVMLFLSGFYLSEKTFKNSVKEIDAFDALIRYQISRDIATNLKNSDVKRAKCEADLHASNGFDDVAKCIKDKQCASYVTNDMQNRFPEFSIGESLKFDYIKSVNGVKRCQENQ